MGDVDMPDGVSQRLRGYGYRPNGTQVDTKQLTRMITRLPGVANDPTTFAGIQYILERYINGNDSKVSEGTDTERRDSGAKQKRTTDVIPTL